MESLDLHHRTRAGVMIRDGAPDSDPARREGLSIEPHRSAALRFMDRNLPLKFDRKRCLVLAVAAALAVPGPPENGWAQVSKGHQILISRGLQVQGMVTKDDVFQLITYSNAHWTLR